MFLKKILWLDGSRGIVARYLVLDTMVLQGGKAALEYVKGEEGGLD